MLKKKRDGKVIRNCRKVAVVEHLRPRILYSADVLAGLLPDLQTDPDDSAQSHPLPWGMARQIRGQVYFIILTKKIVIVYSDAKTDTNSVRARALSRDEQRSRSTNNIPRNRLLRRFSDNFRGMS